MLHKTRGIIFHVTDYAETSVVVKIYTELFGLQSYIINSVRKKNAKVKQNVLQPLSLVELVVYHKERKGINRIKEIRNHPVLQNIPFDVLKSSMVIFMNEVLYKSVREEEPNQFLFGFIFNAVQVLDMQTPANKNFHLFFLIQLTKYLGFYPQDNSSSSKTFFNLQEGVFQSSTPAHPFYLDEPLSKQLDALMKTSLNFSSTLIISVSEKRILIERLLEYYSLHVSGFGNIKSHKVLEEVWS